MGIFDRIRKGLKKNNGTPGMEKESLGIKMSPQVKVSQGSEILTAWRMEELSKFEPSYYPEPSKPTPPFAPSASPESSNWPDEQSRMAEEFLMNRGIQIHWHYGDKLGDDFTVVGLRVGGSGVVFFVESERYGQKRVYAAKTLRRFLQDDYLSLSSPEQKY